MANVRLVRVVGQHGAGKSAVLKQVALEESAGAPILVLRDLRVTGGGWPAHAAKFGKVASIVTILREIGLAGSRTLFIDGADRMNAAAQVTVNDVLKTIAETPDLDGWRVVMTMREENAQRVDSWLDPDANATLSSRTIRVEGFDNEEVVEAAEAVPALRPLLADSRSYDMVLRRPFFLDALSRLPAAGGGAIRSEIDLVELWWEHGGADGADFASAQRRRNVLFTLGERLLANPVFRSPSGTSIRLRSTSSCGLAFCGRSRLASPSPSRMTFTRSGCSSASCGSGGPTLPPQSARATRTCSEPARFNSSPRSCSSARRMGTSGPRFCRRSARGTYARPGAESC